VVAGGAAVVEAGLMVLVTVLVMVGLVLELPILRALEPCSRDHKQGARQLMGRSWLLEIQLVGWEEV